MLMISLFLYCSLFSPVGNHQVVKYAYHQITDLYYRKTKAITASIPDFLLILVQSFKGTDGICETIKTFYCLSNLRAVLLQLGLGHRGDVPIITNLVLMKQRK